MKIGIALMATGFVLMLVCITGQELSNRERTIINLGLLTSFLLLSVGLLFSVIGLWIWAL